MNLFRISARNLRLRLLSSSLTTLSIAVGVAMIASIWLLIAQADQRYKQSTAGYKAIVGPKEGSPLSIALNTIYNLGAANGVVPFSVYRELLDGKLARKVRTTCVVPQARGDTWRRDYPIIGTTDEMFSDFSREQDDEGNDLPLAFAEGGAWEFGHEEFTAFVDLLAGAYAQGGSGEAIELGEGVKQAVLGAAVASEQGVVLGDEIVPVHGSAEEVDAGNAYEHTESACKVVGILERTGTPIDRAIYIPMSVFMTMDKHDALRPGQDPEAGNVLISAIIIDARAHMTEFILRNEFQTRGDAQAVSPSVEIRQFLQQVGDASDLLRLTAYLVLIVAAISVCVALYNTMNERRREIAIMRSLGARRHMILRLILQEAVAICLLGGVLGVALCHAAAWQFERYVAIKTSVAISWDAFSVDELWLILGVCVLGGAAGLLPALKGSRTEVAENLGPTS